MQGRFQSFVGLEYLSFLVLGGGGVFGIFGGFWGFFGVFGIFFRLAATHEARTSTPLSFWSSSQSEIGRS